ncbi:hypothetical protein ACFFHH_01725 [Cytobacillus solani]|uniref:Uncharacterized protein n=1 Tax=Cytobacillus solani TaxID=1637975 RepID=A0A0Q3VJG3_9BACI|nr:hypothetical protein [Cytobacillus solani]KOP72022.1 hypothetical protein AMS60_22425 [Bacillus sp. FJAT-21945]KQL21319.1 hypothetical protein AN957_24000 [Cytobacillus solani]USK54610.1 hypothetical protein LIS82_24215 [Cytobacillus solani]
MAIIGGVGEGPVSQFVVINKQIAETAIKERILDVLEDPSKRIREIQQPSPFSQFIDIKI